MEAAEKKSFTRQMYTADSEVGKMKLQSVKENLYEATTKVVLYSVEMYTKTSLQDWVQTGLIEKLDKANKDLKRERDELEQGHIGMFDITNGCSVINDFVRKDALDISRVELNEKIEYQKNKQKEIIEKEGIIERRKVELENGDEEETEPVKEDAEGPEFFEGAKEEDNDLEEDMDENDMDDDLDGDDADAEPESPSEIELFARKVAAIKNLEDMASFDEDIDEEKEAVEAQLKKLKALTRDGQNLLAIQFDEEKESLENLRTLRNTVFAHKTEDLQEISLIGSWEPEAGPLYQWASEILKYIRVIEQRYRAYASFDEFYATKEGKDKFDGCKVYVQKQIKELYVNRSSIVFEFAGDLYDKEDEEYNFKKLIENMAIGWDTGIRYLTVVTNEDLPELNVFFKECLSGTNKYVDYYLIDRNALRDSCKKKGQEKDYLYFKLLYHLNPSMEKIYWKDKTFTKKEFARRILYKVIKVKNMFQLEGRLKGYETYIEGIDVLKWCEYHLLSEIYFAGKDDIKGKTLALDMENAILDFYEHGENKGRTPLYRKAIKAAVNLYFYMGESYVFSYTRSNGQTLHWYSLEDACSYLENPRRFKSYAEVSGFVDEMYKSEYFKLWRNKVKASDKKKEV